MSTLSLAKIIVDKKSKTKAYLTIALAAILFATNIAIAVNFSNIFSSLTIICSNLITIFLLILAWKPINSILEDELNKRQAELDKKNEAEKNLVKKVEDLEKENKKLSSELDSKKQVENINPSIQYTFKVEQMQYSKVGYVVKEEYLKDLDYKVDETFWKSIWPDSGDKKILYIKKLMYKAAIGIDFTKIKYCYNNDRIKFYGVKFENLHDLSSEIRKEAESVKDVYRCEVLTENSDKKLTKVNNDKIYDELKKHYANEQRQFENKQNEYEVERLCVMLTTAMHESLQQKFNNIDFIDNLDDASVSNQNIFSLQSATDRKINEIASTILMLTTVITKIQPAESFLFSNVPESNRIEIE